MAQILPDISVIEVREGSTPTRVFTFHDDQGNVVDVSGYQITLTVKPFLVHPDGVTGPLADSRAIFSLNASSLGATGSFSFVFTKAHTYIGFGDWPAEIRWYTGGAPSSGTGPSDAKQVIFRVWPAVDNNPV